ncbi:MAG: hypothetical protein ICV73_09815 [Acetobacteraceae bacterium]|nr:hypothetical protein [Acetobacteraceae bacterium]
MPATDPIAAETLAFLQQAVLAAVLSGQPIHGSAHRVNLPDLGFALRRPSVALSAENLAGPIDTGSLPRPVQLIGTDEEAREAVRREGAGFLAFRPAVVEDGGVRLTLEVRAAPPGGTAGRALPLSAVQVRFRRSDGGWDVAGPPVQMSN